MSGNGFKLAYSASALRVRCVVTADFCSKSGGKPPNDALSMAKNKLRAEQAAGALSYFEFYLDEFESFCEQVAESPEAFDNPAFKVSFTLAQGMPNLNGISVEPSPEQGQAYQLSVTADPSIMANWRYEWFRLEIRRQANEKRIEAQPNESQIFSNWLRAKRGESVTRAVISNRPDMRADKPFSIIGNQSRKDLILIIYSSEIYRQTTALEGMIQSAGDACKKMSIQTGVAIEHMREMLVKRVKASMHGPERFGVNLPQTILIGFPSQPVEAAEEPAPGSNPEAPNSEASNVPEPVKPTPVRKKKPKVANKNYEGKGTLKIEIDDSAMEASICKFDVNLYEEADFEMSEQWLRNEVERHGIVFGFTDRNVGKLMEAIIRCNDLTGMVVAQGQDPVPGGAPFLYESYKNKVKSNTRRASEYARRTATHDCESGSAGGRSALRD